MFSSLHSSLHGRFQSIFIHFTVIFYNDHIFLHFPQLIARYSNVCSICLTAVDHDAIDNHYDLTDRGGNQRSGAKLATSMSLEPPRSPRKIPRWCLESTPLCPTLAKKIGKKWYRGILGAADRFMVSKVARGVCEEEQAAPGIRHGWLSREREWKGQQ